MTHQFTTADIAALRHASDSASTGKIRAIAGQASATAGMTLARVLSTDRSPQVVRVRDVICYVAQQQGFSSVQIGRAMNRDHSSVLTAIRREKARRGEA